MAVTKGQGNPNWTREETALALELYFRLDQKMPSASDEEVVELSSFLRNMNLHEGANKNKSFRNPDGIAFKVGNLRAVATGLGLKNYSKVDQLVWAEFGADRDALAAFCSLIRSGVAALDKSIDRGREDDDSEFDEGKILTRVHKTRERNRTLRAKLIRKLQSKNECRCAICGIEPNASIGEFGLRMFECHHIIPISESVTRKTKLSDLSLLCANCHRLIHALISKEKKWFQISEARQKLCVSRVEHESNNV